ncbi:peptidoglycan-binding protein [Streptomyces sp. NPDC013455]|uniref:peptidoglycan-binding domain-containing protein n=1 Tax=Streptomyces sp. NPDC013455 TaxID=3155605 RepID=UPI0033E5429F
MPITQSVGVGGANLRSEAQYVQALLNVFRADHGLSALELDGRVGPLTVAAIENFQNAVTGVVDGRVDPGGPAIIALEEQIAPALDEVRAVTILSLPLSYRPAEEEPPVEEEPVLDDGELQTTVDQLTST